MIISVLCLPIQACAASKATNVGQWSLNMTGRFRLLAYNITVNQQLVM